MRHEPRCTSAPRLVRQTAPDDDIDILPRVQKTATVATREIAVKRILSYFCARPLNPPCSLC
jgi:hypothetical protein